MLVDYAKVDPWSVDDAYYIADGLGWLHLYSRSSAGAYKYLRRLKTYQSKYGSARDYGTGDNSTISLMGDNSNWLWANNPAAPHLIYYTGTGATNAHRYLLKAYNADTDTISIVHDFTPTIKLVNSWGDCSYTATTVDMQREGNQSDDDRYWAFGVTNGSANGWCAVLVYDKTSDTVISLKTLGANGLCGASACKAVATFGYPNWVGMSPSGKYVIFNWQTGANDATWTRGHGTEVYDTNLNWLGVASSGNGHGDVGYDVNGVEIYVDRATTAAATYSYYELESCNLSMVSKTKSGSTSAGSCQHYQSLPCTWYKAGDPTNCPAGSSHSTWSTFFISMRGSHGAAQGWMLFSSQVVGGPGLTLPTGNGGFGALENVAYQMNWSAGSPFNNSAKVPVAPFVRLGRNRAIYNNNYDAQANAAPNHNFTKFAWTSTWDSVPPTSPTYGATLYSFYTELTSALPSTANGMTASSTVSGGITGSGALTATSGDMPVTQNNGAWAWIGGSSTATGSSKSLAGAYTTNGTLSAGNIPGGRGSFASWTDNTGNLWLFGGGGFDSAGVNGYLNDLWEFSPSARQWAWMGGSSTLPAVNEGRPGVYGKLGTPATDVAPGGREASVSWTDKAGNLWLFGGIGYDSAGANASLNDLWKFDPSTREWAWMNGDSSVLAATKGRNGVYGRLGVPDAGNTPGGRWGASSWTDKSGFLWLFGGLGHDSTGSLGPLSDLWELDPYTDKWAWMGGSSTVGSGSGQAGASGSLGSPSTTHVPSGRSQAVSWVDSMGNFWLFGGVGYDSTGTLGSLNDLWEFNPATREWAWVGGSTTVVCSGCGRPGVYGTLGEADQANNPGGRSQAFGWTDGNGNLWLFGGSGYDSIGTHGTLNDLWEFTPSALKWAWMGGSNTLPGAEQGAPGVYGPKGVLSTGDAPEGRWGAGGSTGSNGELWLFGGEGNVSSGAYTNLNDLWVYQPPSGK
jgi:N-acetylneuraminic acid mutarotase